MAPVAGNGAGSSLLHGDAFDVPAAVGCSGVVVLFVSRCFRTILGSLRLALECLLPPQHRPHPEGAPGRGGVLGVGVPFQGHGPETHDGDGRHPGGVEEQVVDHHEGDAEGERQVVAHDARVVVPADVALRQAVVGVEEPEHDQDGVLAKAEGVVGQVLVPRPLVLGVEEAEDVDGPQGQAEDELLALGVAGLDALAEHPRGHEGPVKGTYHSDPLRVDRGKQAEGQNPGRY